jgi:hypothetical protein
MYYFLGNNAYQAGVPGRIPVDFAYSSSGDILDFSRSAVILLYSASFVWLPNPPM